MGCDRHDGDNGSSFFAVGFIGSVVPKNAASVGGVVLSVRLEYFLVLCTRQGSELVRIKAWMVWIYFQITDRLPDLLKDCGFRRRIFERRVLPICRRSEFDSPSHAYFLACLANEPR